MSSQWSISLRSVMDLSGAHVLIVDDRPSDLRLLIELLRVTSCRISVAFDGSQAYHRAQAVSPDLILMDVRMPRMDGFAVCRLLASTPSTQTIPVVILTAAGALEDRLAGLETGAIDYIVKPFEPAEVIVRIRNHIKRSSRDRQPRNVPELPDNPDSNLVRAAIGILLHDLRKSPALDELAHLVGTHEKRLSRIFRDCLGQTVFEYLRETRLRTAMHLLSTTSMSISDVADEIGFSSAANFATAFREQLGVSPSRWRKRHLGQDCGGTSDEMRVGKDSK
ncbi:MULTISPECIES: response regulator [unclassified Burkholderia]|uniref:response regulator transcription factor n=1 Tax=unclassified Burkholderia TaxID=2613784 RepID=UPI000F5810AD|nr:MULTISPECIES: response regulator [unclassified Burkholderia]RQR30740.1 DNA-binding response regulator [Burkholderia sp. Bp9142]RQR45960.1 DNA-binding response regulator [Burkholderia sp. Bp9140]